jgi:hypothetical protein
MNARKAAAIVVAALCFGLAIGGPVYLVGSQFHQVHSEPGDHASKNVTTGERPMADPISVWPVLVGGALAILGGAVTSGIALATKYFETKHERMKRRAERFEYLVAAIARERQLVEAGIAKNLAKDARMLATM